MIIPEILPSEIWFSYLLRLCKLNDISKLKQAKRLIKQFTHHNYSIAPSIPMLIATLIGKSLNEFSDQHSLIPHFRAVVINDRIDATDQKKGELAYRFYLGREFSSHIKVCSMCMEEDLEFHGFYYYRKEHQLPGFNTCLKHENKLMIAEIEDSEVICRKSLKAIDLEYDEQKFEAIKIYQTISDHWMSCKSSLPLSNYIAVIQEQAKYKNLRWWKNGNAKLFSDELVDVFPKSWIEVFMPEINEKVIGKYFGPIDSLLTLQPVSTHGYKYALILATLFDSADTALNVLSNACLAGKISTSKPKNRNKYEIKDESILNALYVECRGLNVEVARKMGVRPKNSQELLLRRGLVPLKIHKNRELLAFIDFQNGHTICDVCKKHGVTAEEFEIFLRKASSNFFSTVKKFDALSEVK